MKFSATHSLPFSSQLIAIGFCTCGSAAKSVTATVTRVGTYTLGVIMPAGKLTWTVTGVSHTGSGATARTVVSVESNETVGMNDGSRAPAG